MGSASVVEQRRGSSWASPRSTNATPGRGPSGLSDHLRPEPRSGHRPGCVRAGGSRFRHLRAPEACNTYLRRTVVNLCNCLFRHKRVERLALEREAAEASNRTVEGPDIGLRDQLWVALRRLPIRQRTVLILRYYEDQSDEQIAEVMRCSRSAVRSLVSHGVETLRTVIGGEER